MKLINALLAAGLVAVVSTGAAAHGDESHEKKPAGAVKKEQKPWGIAGDTKAVARTIELTMGDNMRFTPDFLEVKQGETIHQPLSRHAWGIAVDLNVDDNPRGSFSTQDARLVEIMRRHGFGWGGTWLVPDPAHYEALPPAEG